MPVKRIRTKACCHCEREHDTLFRVRVVKNGDWIFICKTCIELVKPGNPAYQYGGTWKSKKRH